MRFPPTRWCFSLLLAGALGAASSANAETLGAMDALRMAAADNPTLQAAVLDTEAARLGIDSAQGAHDPTLSASMQGGYDESASGSTGKVTGTTSVSSKVALDYTTDIGTKLEFGTSADLGWRPDSTGIVSPAPSFTALAFVSARQPLLQGAGKDVNLASIVEAKNSADAAEKQEELAASSTALDVLGAYWELWYADRAVQVEEQSLALAKKQLADATTRAIDLGTGSKADALQFATSVASSEDSLSQARTNRASRAIELGRLLGVGADRALGFEVADSLPGLGAVGSSDALVQHALDQSPDLAALRANIETSKSRVAVAADKDQPRVDLFGQVSAGAQFANAGFYGTSGTDYGLLGGRPVFSVVGGIDIELPLGGGAASSDHARALTQLHSAESKYDAKVDSVTADVATKRIALVSAADEVDLSAKTASISKELARAEEQRLELGTGTPSDVVKAEQSARDAELRSLRAQVTAVTKQYQLEHATGSLLQGVASVMSGRKS